MRQWLPECAPSCGPGDESRQLVTSIFWFAVLTLKLAAENSYYSLCSYVASHSYARLLENIFVKAVFGRNQQMCVSCGKLECFWMCFNCEESLLRAGLVKSGVQRLLSSRNFPNGACDSKWLYWRWSPESSWLYSCASEPVWRNRSQPLCGAEAHGPSSPA